MAARPSESKKKSFNVDRMPRDGLTGMGFHTQQHFIEVRHKMNGYLAEQQDYEFDQAQHYPQEHHHHHYPLDPALLDGKRATKPLPSPSTPKKSLKHSSHPTSDSSKPNDRHKKSSSRHSHHK